MINLVVMRNEMLFSYRVIVFKPDLICPVLRVYSAQSIN
jgi:hypothetical protein